MNYDTNILNISAQVKQFKVFNISLTYLNYLLKPKILNLKSENSGSLFNNSRLITEA